MKEGGERNDRKTKKHNRRYEPVTSKIEQNTETAHCLKSERQSEYLTKCVKR
nr:MAG TPA: hypothetical protein [Caudoviricetes sp.]